MRMNGKAYLQEKDFWKSKNLQKKAKLQNHLKNKKILHKKENGKENTQKKIFKDLIDQKNHEILHLLLLKVRSALNIWVKKTKNKR
jgi:hypothetical protein